MEDSVLERVLALSRSMAETRTLAPLLEYALDEAMQLVGATRGYIVLVKSDGSLDFRVVRGIKRDSTPLGEDQISTSILREAIESKTSLVVEDAGSHPRWGSSNSVALLGLRSVMCVPLIAHGEAIGAIYVENRNVLGQFKDEHLPPLILFANQAAVAIENATLNDALEARVAERTQQLEQANVQLEQSWMEAVESNRVRTVLLGNVAHDLRTPLAIIISALQLTLEGAFGDITDEHVEWLGKSLTAARLCTALTNDVFDMSKLEMGKLTLYPEEIDPGELLQQVYDIGLALRWSDGVALQLQCEPVLPLLTVDSKRIIQVLMNLLSNAVKFTTSGTVTLYACAVPDQDAVMMGVRDTGEGIPADKLDSLFMRFNQIDANPHRRRVGTGLGLAICRELVEMHGGQIWVESEIDAGADFKFMLPVR